MTALYKFASCTLGMVRRRSLRFVSLLTMLQLHQHQTPSDHYREQVTKATYALLFCIHNLPLIPHLTRLSRPGQRSITSSTPRVNPSIPFGSATTSHSCPHPSTSTSLSKRSSWCVHMLEPFRTVLNPAQRVHMLAICMCLWEMGSRIGQFLDGAGYERTCEALTWGVHCLSTFAVQPKRCCLFKTLNGGSPISASRTVPPSPRSSRFIMAKVCVQTPVQCKPLEFAAVPNTSDCLP